MKKVVIITALILSGIIILDSFNAGEALFMFILAGVVPGTNTSLSGTAMLAIFGGLIGFVLARIVSRLITAAFAKRQLTPLA